MSATPWEGSGEEGGNWILHHATHAGNVNQVRQLLADSSPHAPNPNCIRHTGRTILHVAAWRGYQTIVGAVLECPRFTEHNRKDLHGRTALQLAICHHNLVIVRQLVQDRRVVSCNGPTLLLACEAHSPKLVQLLVSSTLSSSSSCRCHLEPNFLSPYKGTPLRAAVFHNDLATARLLLEDLGADPCFANHICLLRLDPERQKDMLRLLMASSPRIDFWCPLPEEQGQGHKTLVETWCSPPSALVEAYGQDPEGVCQRLQRELGWAGCAARTWALVVFLDDGLLHAPSPCSSCSSSGEQDEAGRRRRRFLKMACRLHPDLQMVLCQRVFGSGRDLIPHRERGNALARLVQDLEAA